MRATAKVQFILTKLQSHGRLRRLFCQTDRAYDQLIRLPKVFLGIGDEKINATLATEPVLLTVMAVRNRVFFADPQPYERATSGWTNECLH